MVYTLVRWCRMRRHRRSQPLRACASARRAASHSPGNLKAAHTPTQHQRVATVWRMTRLTVPVLLLLLAWLSCGAMAVDGRLTYPYAENTPGTHNARW